jgi:hypothetical protein
MFVRRSNSSAGASHHSHVLSMLYFFKFSKNFGKL